MEFPELMEHIMMQESVSHGFNLCPSSNFMTKKREDLAILLIQDFLHLIQFKLGHI